MMPTLQLHAVPSPPSAPSGLDHQPNGGFHQPMSRNMQNLFHSLGIAQPSETPTLQAHMGIINSTAQNSIDTCSFTLRDALLMACGVSQPPEQSGRATSPPDPTPPTAPSHKAPAAQPNPDPRTHSYHGTAQGQGQHQPPPPEANPVHTHTHDTANARAKATRATIQRLLDEQHKDSPPGPPALPDLFVAARPKAKSPMATAAIIACGSSSRVAISFDSDAMEDDRDNTFPKRTRQDGTPITQSQASNNTDEASTPARPAPK